MCSIEIFKSLSQPEPEESEQPGFDLESIEFDLSVDEVFDRLSDPGKAMLYECMTEKEISVPKKWRKICDRLWLREARRRERDGGWNPEALNDLDKEIIEFLFAEMREAGYHSMVEKMELDQESKLMEDLAFGIQRFPMRDPIEVVKVVRKLNISSVRNEETLSSILSRCIKERFLRHAIELSEAFKYPTEHLYIELMIGCERHGKYDAAAKCAAKINDRRKLSAYIRIGEILHERIINVVDGKWLHPEITWRDATW